MRKFHLIIVASVLLASLAACVKEEKDSSSQPRRYEATREMMGTFVTVTVWAQTRQQANVAIGAAFARLQEVDSTMSDYKPDSELSKINAEAADHPVEISDGMLAVLKASLMYSELTDGAFDITMRPLKRLWKSAERTGAAPEDDAIETALGSVGYRNIELDEQNKTVRFLKKGMELDLGAIAKGYSADLAAAELKRLNIPAGLVNIGGNIVVHGLPPAAKTWKIGIIDPAKRDERLPHVVHLASGAVATSGDYERFFEIGGKRYSHIFDPRTGRPVEHINSVTVVAPDGITSDALSTALSVMGPDAGLAFASKLAGADVMFIVGGAGGPTVATSPGFDGYLKTE